MRSVIVFRIYLILFTSRVEAQLIIKRPHRCCRSDQLLLTPDRKCVNRNVIKNNRSIGDLPFSYITEEQSDASFNCSKGHLESTTISNFNQSDKEHCVQSSASKEGVDVVLYCRPPTQIRKCCPRGKIVNRNQIDHCIEFNGTNTLEDNIEKFTNYYSSEEDWIVEENKPIYCEYDYNIYLPGYFVDHKFIVDQQHGLYVKRAAYKPIRESQEYCVDLTRYSNSSIDLIAMICLPPSFFRMRWLLHHVYPYINFFSAILVLLTFLTYLLLPSLRDNVQGYSMLCFLGSLTIMHLENGVFLAYRYEPHTWCLSKACVSGYFRLASSTWITVMGFNIWRQLQNVTRRPTKSQLLRGFLLRCLYAWGVPLAFILASHFYKQQNGCPDYLNRCWSCDSISRNLSQTPNVVLVTGNLIFFIPSALKVYKSLSFLQTATIPGNSLNKMERGRIQTLFRLFVLMQFYTVPRIIQWFVDSDRVKTELLMLCASIFLMIGPCIFYFFVCRREIIAMLKDQLSMIVRGFKNPNCRTMCGCCGRSRSYNVNGTNSLDTRNVTTQSEIFSSTLRNQDSLAITDNPVCI